MPASLSAILITKDCQNTVEACLHAVARIANEIIVLDSGSTDDTLSICQRYTQQVYSTDWPGYGQQKQRALNLATQPWVLSIDSDEILTEACQAAILAAIQTKRFCAYRIARQMIFAGKRLKHSGCADNPIRLFQRQAGRFSNDIVHESVLIEGEIGRIKQPMLHYSYQDIGDWISKMNRYSELSTQKDSRKKHYTVKRALASAVIGFCKMYFGKQGFLDGRLGLVAAINAAVACYYKYLKLALNQKFTQPGSELTLVASSTKKTTSASV